MNNRVKGDYQAVLEQNGTLSFVPNGNSMWPFIKNRSQTVIIEKVKSPLKKYDVVFFKRADQSYVLHRIVQVLENEYVVRGDSLDYLEKVNNEQIIGVMTGFYKGKNLVSSSDEKYLKEVKKWYKNTPFTRFRIKCFNLSLRIKAKLKKIFSKKEK